MTPKEKAEDLVNQFRMVLMNEDTECGNEILCTSIAIKNALILVENVKGFANPCCISDSIKYWGEVKQELNKL